ncbi:MAG: hypothetical protein WCT37_03935 [Patescibacteria group bacterium]|jgi:hypothetical protein
MSGNYQKLFNFLTAPEPSAGLENRIINRLHQEQRLVGVKRRLVAFFLVAVSSLVALLPLGQLVKTSLIESDFIQFASLLISDFGVILASWQSFSLTLLETLPIINLLAVLAVILLLLESLKFLARELKSFSLLNHYN